MLSACGGSDQERAGEVGPDTVDCLQKLAAPRELFRATTSDTIIPKLSGNLLYVYAETYDGERTRREYSIYNLESGEYVSPQEVVGLSGSTDAVAAGPDGLVLLGDTDSGADDGKRIVVTFVNPAGELVWEKQVSDGGSMEYSEDEQSSSYQYDYAAVTAAVHDGAVFVTNGKTVQGLSAEDGSRVDPAELPTDTLFANGENTRFEQIQDSIGDLTLMRPAEGDTDESTTFLVDLDSGKSVLSVENVYGIEPDGSLISSDPRSGEISRTTSDGDQERLLTVVGGDGNYLPQFEDYEEATFCGEMSYWLSGGGRIDAYETDSWKRTSSLSVAADYAGDEADLIYLRQGLLLVAPTAVTADADVTEYAFVLFPSS